jgi:putative endonuclease
MKGYVYIIGNSRPTLYIGVTSNLVKRIYEHKQGVVEGFTKTYSLHKLLYYEQYDSMTEAIAREKQLKNWHRDWKLILIKEHNSSFEDLYTKIIG